MQENGDQQLKVNYPFKEDNSLVLAIKTTSLLWQAEYYV